jgi:clathrin heavy chain
MALRSSCTRPEATIYMYYLEQVQSHDMKSVNESLNGIYIEEEDYLKLNASVSNYTNFDQVSASLY